MLGGKKNDPPCWKRVLRLRERLSPRVLFQRARGNMFIKKRTFEEKRRKTDNQRRSMEEVAGILALEIRPP